jgi:hypothetical protein
MRTLAYVGGGLIALWILMLQFGKWQCRRSGHRWVGVHAQFEGRVKVACGRCGELGWMTTEQWQQYFSALGENEKQLAGQFRGAPDTQIEERQG